MGTNTTYNSNNFTGIFYDQSQTVLFKPLLGILNQPKYLPIRYCPITIEIELVNDMREPILTPVGTNFTPGNTSVLWQIENVQFKCDNCTLDNALDNSYAQHLLSRKSLPINYNTYVSQMQSTISNANRGQQTVRLNITRALSRLKSVFFNLNFSPTISG